MLSGLDGKVAVVTGAAGGLGAAAALRLSREGCLVVVVDIDGDGARRVAESLPGQSIAVTADVSAEEGVERYLDEATRSFGRIDLHHLNAGIPGSAGGFPDLSAAEFDRVMAVNVRGIFLGLRGAFQRYRAQRAAGSVVLTASIASLRGSADLIAYQTSKHAVLGLLHGAAMYGGPLGIRVNAVAPGYIDTATAPGDLDAGRRAMAARTPAGRLGTPEEVAATVAFLASEEAAFFVGATLSPNGGLVTAV